MPAILHGERTTNFEEKRAEITNHLQGLLLPFWIDHAPDWENGGYNTHFDRDGRDTGVDEKSLIAQTRLVYTFSSAYRSGYGDSRCGDLARHGVDYLLDIMWDKEHDGFFWTTDRKGTPRIRKKIFYGHSFAIYALSEYTLATGDPRGLRYAEAVFDLIQKHCTDTMFGGYFEMFEADWSLCGPGAGGGDRKTLDVHMHLMEAFTTLYEAGGKELHKRKLLEIIHILTERIMHPVYGTGIPQFWEDWRVAPQIKFDIVWGWDRFADGGAKAHADDNTSAGHNAEFAWLLWHALEIAGEESRPFEGLLKKQLDHVVANGIDYEYGGVYVEGPHEGGVSDMEKEFWQQIEVMIGMLEGYIRLGDHRYLEAYEIVHRFLFAHGINFDTGELWPLLTRGGAPIWDHTSHSWKINYHSVRGMIQCAERLKNLAGYQ